MRCNESKLLLSSVLILFIVTSEGRAQKYIGPALFYLLQVTVYTYLCLNSAILCH